MPILSAQTIRSLCLLDPCRESFKDVYGNSGGLSVCGYDLTIAQDIKISAGGFVLASAVERFNLPSHIAGIVHDKSILARIGIAVQNTVAEPGWRGFLTLEITNHGETEFSRMAGASICQVIFHFLDAPSEAPYSGKYQDQGEQPQGAK